MNPLTLKSTNLKNINLFWVQKIHKNNPQKSSGNPDFFYFSLTFHHLSQFLFSALSRQGLFETLTTMTCVTNERELSPDIRVRNKTPVVQ